MGKWIILFSLLILTTVVADEETLFAGRGLEIDGKNITLVKFDRGEDKTLFCVNGEKKIIEEDDKKYVNDVFIEVKQIREDRVLVDIEYDCKDCVCGDECDNSVCFDEVEIVELDEEEIVEGEFVEDVDEDDEIERVGVVGNQEEELMGVGVGLQSVVIAVLIMAVIILGMIYLWKKS